MKKENPIEIINEILLRMNYNNSLSLSENILVLEQKPDHLMPFQPDNPANTGVPRAKMTASDLMRGMENASIARKEFVDTLRKITVDDFQHFLDWVGLVPVIGDAVDIGNAIGYLIRAMSSYYENDETKGNSLLVEFSLSIIAIIPIIGSPIKLGLKSIPWSKIFNGGTELSEAFWKMYEKVPISLRKQATAILDTIKKTINTTINWVQKLLGKIKNSKIIKGLNILIKGLENLYEIIVKGVKSIVKPVVKTSEKLGKQAIKWTGKIIDSPAGGAWIKSMKNLSKEMCGPERQQSEWAKERIPADVFLIGGQFKGNIACDVLSAMAWTSGPLGPLMSASIEIENARNYYEQGEKLMGDIQLVLGFLPFIGTVGKGVIQSVGKNSVDVLTSPSFLYKMASWIEGEGTIKLTSDEVKAIIELGKEGLKKDASNALKNFAFKVEWIYKNAAELGLGPNVVTGLRMSMPKLLSSIERVFDVFIRLSIYLGSAKAVEVSEGKEIELEQREKTFKSLDEIYKKKDSFSDTTDDGNVQPTSRTIKNLPDDERKLFKGNYNDTTPE
jgi:hypothetical protein